jgi:Tol biopolymer transport system component
VGLTAALGWIRAEAQQPGQDIQLRKAMETETVQGCKDAVVAYKKLGDGTDRAVASKALVRLAECYQKLGDAQAKAVYERIVSQFSDQKEAYSVARSRLGSVPARPASPGSTGLTIQQVPNAAGRQVSPDGRFVSANLEQNIALRDVGTGKVTSLSVVKPEGMESYPDYSTFSPDGKQLAVEWYYGSDNRSRLWVVDTVGEGPRKPRVLYDNPDVGTISPFDWSPDGRWIATLVLRKDKTAQIGLVSVTDGSLRVLRSIEWLGASHMEFSPDSRYLAFDRPAAEDAVDRDVFVLAVDGSRQIAAVVNPGEDCFVGWAPDGSRLLFSSDRGGTVGLWSIAFRAGAVHGRPEFVTDVGYGRSMGLTSSGTLYYSALKAGAEIWTAFFDAATGQLSSVPVNAIKRFNGHNNMPEWSADGKYLAYASRRSGQPITMVISAADTGEMVREVRPKLSYYLYARWSPDGRTFVARGADLKGRSGIVKFDAVTGDASLVVLNEVCSGLPSWTPSGDGTFLCYNSGGKKIVQIDAASGAVRRSWPVGSQTWGTSPNGRYLVYDDPGLKVLDTQSGASRELLKVDEKETRLGNRTTIAFTPDSRHVAFAATIRGESGMWLVPVEGGEPRRLKVDAARISMWRFNPKTGQVAFAPSNAPSYEARKLENFLPSTAARK